MKIDINSNNITPDDFHNYASREKLAQQSSQTKENFSGQNATRLHQKANCPHNFNQMTEQYAFGNNTFRKTVRKRGSSINCIEQDGNGLNDFEDILIQNIASSANRNQLN